MKFTPWIVGAAICVPLAGAIAGASMDTDPIGTVTDVTASIPDHSNFAKADAAPKTQARLPDHYAMETPDGLVEVHELAMRGQDRDRWQAARAYEREIEAELARLEAGWNEDTSSYRTARRLDAQQPIIRRQDNIYDAAQRRIEAPHYAAMERADTGRYATGEAIKPLDTREPVTIAAATQVEPRTIDVEAELNRQR
ncbi:hypothetical protein [Aurantiacibacter gangjinensis]|uniref:Uncharacterized protein n=1 Tax=Aurantiacibacter gangjinensis TaxID=502682 RepID=A0A0G9MRI8_9SPHN|nr:hypothetical protein [Aurantiacibacter gangjinensis]APE27994.1 hypothetical protein BMF35_a1165 [Aurantiacibacter gangjinensis]KLE31933.1 hypothetical protein AAW01_10840 [Aurantiacibacter gangjinensis]